MLAIKYIEIITTNKSGKKGPVINATGKKTYKLSNIFFFKIIVHNNHFLKKN